MKADRLLAILSALQTSGRATARELADRLEVSERTIHRDMETLGMAGIPVVADRGYRGGWSLPEGYRTRITGLTSEEISSLLLLGSSSVVRDLGLAGSAQAAFRKLLAALPASVRDSADTVRQRIHIDGAGWRAAGAYAADPRLLAVVQEAVWDQRTLRFRYRSVDSDAESERTVRPLGLVAKQSVWYMVGLPVTDAGDDPQAEAEPRSYRISRFTDARPLEERFERPEGFDLAAYWERSTERFKAALPRYPARVRLAASDWPRFRRERYVRIESHHQRPDDWIEADAVFDTPESALSILLGYGSKAEALEPEELRQAVIAEMKAMSGLYRD